jgi:hypothetical protein
MVPTNADWLRHGLTLRVVMPVWRLSVFADVAFTTAPTVAVDGSAVSARVWPVGAGVQFRLERPQWRISGGTTSILARMEAQIETYDRPRIEATRLSLDRVRWHLRRLWRLPLEERKQIVGLPKNRADIILTGVAIYESIMEHFEFDVLRVSTRGLRFAAVMDQPASP